MQLKLKLNKNNRLQTFHPGLSQMKLKLLQQDAPCQPAVDLLLPCLPWAARLAAAVIVAGTKVVARAEVAARAEVVI